MAGLAMTASGCVTLGGFGATEAGPAVSGVDLSDASFTVGSREFTEQLLLGQIAGQALAAAGASVTDETGLVGTYVVRESLESQAIDLYWEYTGTAWIAILGETQPIDDEREQYQAVVKADRANGMHWLPMSDLNNTYGFALTEQEAKKKGIQTISDIPTVPTSQMSLCAEAAFIGRLDGLIGVERAYGFSFPQSGISELEYGLLYPTIGTTTCTFGEVFTTDGRIATEDLYVLEDDKEFFPQYNAAPVMRNETYRAHKEELDQLFAPIIDQLDNQAMIDLNAQVDVDGRSEEDVAHDYLVDIGVLAE